MTRASCPGSTPGPESGYRCRPLHWVDSTRQQSNQHQIGKEELTFHIKRKQGFYIKQSLCRWRRHKNYQEHCIRRPGSFLFIQRRSCLCAFNSAMKTAFKTKWQGEVFNITTELNAACFYTSLPSSLACKNEAIIHSARV